MWKTYHERTGMVLNLWKPNTYISQVETQWVQLLKIHVIKTNFQKNFMIIRGSIKKNYPKLRNKTKKWLSSVQFSCSVVSNSLWPHEPQHASPPCQLPTAGVYPNPGPLSQWCHPSISSSVIPFSSCPQSFSATGSFKMSQLFTWGAQTTGVSASRSVLPMNSQDWSPLGWTGWISLQSKGLSRAFSNTTVQKHQFFIARLSSQSNSHIHTWLLEKP